MIAISSAYKKALVAVEIMGNKVFKQLDANCKHSENLLPALDSALNEAGASIKENDYFGVVVGPGSFTGVRISAAMVKGFLAGDSDKKIIPITTFELMAYSYIKNFSPRENFVCIINGLSGYYFICEFDYDGNQVGEERMITNHQLSQNKLQTVGLEEENIAQMLVDPTAEELLELSKEKLAKKILTSADKLVPLYLRKSQAEDALEEKEKKSKIC